MFLGAGRAALLQLAHPWVTTALAQHSSLLDDPIARFQNTFRIVFTMIFGSVGQALAASRHLHALHTGIRGEMADAVAGWPAGSHYEANTLSALRWVYATLVESAVLAYECVGHLSDAEREQYYEESKTTAALFGIPREALPRDWTAFNTYMQEMIASDTLGVSETARSMAHNLLVGAGSWIHPPVWYRAVSNRMDTVTSSRVVWTRAVRGGCDESGEARERWLPAPVGYGLVFSAICWTVARSAGPRSVTILAA